MLLGACIVFHSHSFDFVAIDLEVLLTTVAAVARLGLRLFPVVVAVYLKLLFSYVIVDLGFGIGSVLILLFSLLSIWRHCLFLLVVRLGL